MRRAGFLWLSAAIAGCGGSSEPESLPPLGEVVLSIDTNAAVPVHVGRVRIDIFSRDGVWLESRDFALPSGDDLPISLSLFVGEGAAATEALVRVRGYPEGKERDYQGEARVTHVPEAPPAVVHDAAAVCTNPTNLTLGGQVDLRVAGGPFAMQLECGASKTASGVAAVRLQVDTPGMVRIETVASQPSLDWNAYGDPLIVVRDGCGAPAALGCNDNAGKYGPLAGLTLQLSAGEHYVLVGNRAPGPMDVTVRATRAEEWSKSTVTPPAPRDTGPRLIVAGEDVTPASEPDPALTIDSLVRVAITPGVKSYARVVLDAECTGTMADLAGRAACSGREGEIAPVGPIALSTAPVAAKSAAGTWAGYTPTACAPAPDASPARVCVEGGVLVLGDPSVFEFGGKSGTPERLALVAPFRIDEVEYTVGRYRAALAAGFVSPDESPLVNIKPLAYNPAVPGGQEYCTWNANADGTARFPAQEELPLNCVSWATARALCKAAGGDLPSAVQFERAATAAGRTREVLFPTGQDVPRCSDVAFARWGDVQSGSDACYGDAGGFGPVATKQEPWASTDRTPAGVRGLTGNVAEWVLDAHRGYEDPCWASDPMRAVGCDEDEAPLRTVKGGDWKSPAGHGRGAARRAVPPRLLDSEILGFRCAYPGDAK